MICGLLIINKFKHLIVENRIWNNDFNLFIAGIGGADLDPEIFDTSNLTVFNQSQVNYGSFYCQIKKDSIVYTSEEIREGNKKKVIFSEEISDL